MDLGSLTQKKGPLPVWAWALITAGVLYLLYRRFGKGKDGTSVGTQAVTSTDPGGNNVAAPPTSISSGPLDTSGTSITPVDNLPNTNVGDNTLLPSWMDNPISGLFPFMPLQSGNPTDTPIVEGTPVIPAHSAPGKVPVSRTSTPALKSIIPGITGVVKSQKVLPSGAKLVTLASGKQIEQAKGKKAYVVKRGR